MVHVAHANGRGYDRGEADPAALLRRTQVLAINISHGPDEEMRTEAYR